MKKYLRVNPTEPGPFWPVTQSTLPAPHRRTHVWCYESHPKVSNLFGFVGHQRQVSCDAATWYYGLGMAFLAIATPSVPCILGITALFSRYVCYYRGVRTCVTEPKSHISVISVWMNRFFSFWLSVCLGVQ